MTDATAAARPDVGSDGETLLAVVAEVVAEVHHHGPPVPVTLDSRLDRDLGLDSLAIVELGSRVEERFGVHLPDDELAAVDTPRALLGALVRATPSGWVPAVIRSRQAPTVAAGRPPASASTLLEVLDTHAGTQPDRIHIRLLTDDGDVTVDHTSLRDEAAAAAGGILERGVEPGESVALMLPTCREYFTSFFGILLAGAVPVPIYPPARPSQLEDHLRRQARILENAHAAALVTAPEALRLARLVRGQLPGLRHVVSAPDLPARGVVEARPRIAGHDLALLQYTSGSTGDPKGVMLTHANLLANIRAMGEAAGIDAADVFVSWLPLYHDMGLIGAWLGSLYFGIPLVVMSPVAFLTHPVRWLRAIDAARGTISAAPNFGYELCLTKASDADLEGLDLSSLRLAFNGAEPVSPDTIDRFAARFAPYGLRREAITPVYGLAESSVGLAFPPIGRGPMIDRIVREPFYHHGRAEPAGEQDPNALRTVSCGRALPGHRIRVVDATGQELGERREGRIEFRGPSATTGYVRNPDATRRLLRDGWFDTGDLGYLAGAELYVTGRVKDIVIRAGRNLHPDELEAAVGALRAVRTGRVAVFGSVDPATGTERLIVLAETRESEPEALAALRDRVVAVTVDLLGSPPDEVVLAPPGTVLKTSSGKIRRAASRDAYEQGTLGAGRGPAWWQVARFAGSTTAPRLRRGRRALSGTLLGLYAWIWLAVLAPLTWLLVVTLPWRRGRWAVLRAASRLLLGGTGTDLSVRDAKHVPVAEPCVVVANHPSYLDALALATVLRGTPRFVAAAELSRRPTVRLFLERLGTEFVERADREQSVTDAHRLLELARGGESLVIFPEGRLSRVPGLRPFHLGAFVIAATAGRPVVPVAVAGTRSILRPGHALPRPGRVEITIAEPLRARNGWEGALRLRDDARAAILAHCGEPDLAGP